MEKPVGSTKDAGYEIGVRKTFPVAARHAWDFMFSGEGLALWLGKLKDADLEEGAHYKTTAGTEGVIRVLKPFSHIRLTWKKKDWTNVSTLQVRAIEAASGKATISFHHEKLSDAGQREEMKAHWDAVIEKIAQKMKM